MMFSTHFEQSILALEKAQLFTDGDCISGGTTPNHVFARSEFEVHRQIYKE